MGHSCCNTPQCRTLSSQTLNVCTVHLYIRTRFLIRRRASRGFSVPSQRIRKKSRRGFHGGFYADGCWAHLSLIHRADVMCSHLANNQHTTTQLCVSMTAAKRTQCMCQGLMSPSTMAEAGPIISFSHCLFYERKGIEELMCPLLASFLTHAPVHKYIG